MVGSVEGTVESAEINLVGRTADLKAVLWRWGPALSTKQMHQSEPVTEQPLKDTTKSRDMYETVKKKLRWFFFVHVSMSRTVSDGAWHWSEREACKSVEDSACHSKLMFNEVSWCSRPRNSVHRTLEREPSCMLAASKLNLAGAEGLFHLQAITPSMCHVDYGDICFSALGWLSRSPVLDRF